MQRITLPEEPERKKGKELSRCTRIHTMERVDSRLGCQDTMMFYPVRSFDTIR